MKKKSSKALPKAAQHGFAVKGATALDQSRWVRLTIDGEDCDWIPYADFMDTGRHAKQRLADQNKVLLNDDFKTVMSLVAELRSFPQKPLAHRSGWVGSCFALTSAKILGRSGKQKPGTTFSDTKNTHRVKGELADWQQKVAVPLIGQKLATFILMVPFTAPLLNLTDHSLNFGFELSGPGGAGKSTLCQVASSVIGPMDDVIVSMNSTTNAIDQLMPQFNDMTLILEEMNMFSLQAGKNVGEGIAGLVFGLGYGTSKRRYNQQPEDRARFVWLTSSNQPFPETLDALPRDTAIAAMDRMITLGFGSEREYGVFDKAVPSFESPGALAASITQAARENYGHPIARYLKQLTKAHGRNQDALRAEILKLRDKFVNSVSALNMANCDRVVEAFGLVFAAGTLAQRFEILPKGMDCMKSARHAYKMHLESRKAVATPVERLLRLQHCPDVLDLRNHEKGTREEIDNASAILWNSSGGDELLLTKRHLAQLVPKPAEFLKDRAVSQAMVREDKRKRVYRYTQDGSQRERYFCFRLELLHDNGHW